MTALSVWILPLVVSSLLAQLTAPFVNCCDTCVSHADCRRHFVRNKSACFFFSHPPTPVIDRREEVAKCRHSISSIV